MKPKRVKPNRNAAERLLRHLATAEAFALRARDDTASLALYSVRGGISLGAGTVPAAAADALVAADCARWDDHAPARPRLVVTRAGRARARRGQADPEHRFLAQHRPLEKATVEVAGISASVRVDAAESPLAWLRRRSDRAGRPLLDAAQFAAGERLRTDLTLAQILPRVTANWSASAARERRTPAGATLNDTIIAARQRVSRALDHVGPDFSGLLIDVCGFLKGLEAVERERGWPARAGKLILRMALTRLADHYGLASEARGPARSPGIRAWSQPPDAP